MNRLAQEFVNALNTFADNVMLPNDTSKIQISTNLTTIEVRYVVRLLLLFFCLLFHRDLKKTLAA